MLITLSDLANLEHWVNRGADDLCGDCSDAREAVARARGTIAALAADRRHADVGHDPERRGVLIHCPQCGARFPLTSGTGPVGSKVFTCRDDGPIGPGVLR